MHDQFRVAAKRNDEFKKALSDPEFEEALRGANSESPATEVMSTLTDEAPEHVCGGFQMKMRPFGRTIRTSGASQHAETGAWRRGWDSNPRAGITRPSDFESAPL